MSVKILVGDALLRLRELADNSIDCVVTSPPYWRLRDYGVVLDPFGGAGTSALVAEQEQRDSILIELNSEYVGIAKRRLSASSGLFSDCEVA